MVRDLVDKAYTGSASLGTMYASTGVFVGLAFGALFFIVGAIVLATPADDPAVADERAAMGWTSLGLGIAIILLGFVGMFLSLRFKPVAAAVGVLGAGSVMAAASSVLRSAVNGITSQV
jgi:uncharacterized BrkB/YihY/UPF0761 family membrane protein